MKNVFAILLCLTFPAWATTYVVAPSGGDHTTIQAAFDGHDLAAGDIVEVRASSPGGRQVYQEMVTIGSNDGGSAGNPVTLRARAGDVIVLDEQLTRDNGIYVPAGVNYFTVNGFYVTNAVGYSIRVNGNDVTIQSNRCDEVFTGSGTTLTKNAIVFLNVTNPICEWNTVRTEAAIYDCDNDTDGITLGANFNPIVRYNDVRISTSATAHTPQHNDGIQGWSCYGSQIYGNKISMPIARGYQQGIFLEFYKSGGSSLNSGDYGTNWIYNNFVSGYGGSYMLQLYQYETSGINAKVAWSIFNNTIDAYDQAGSLPFRHQYDGTYSAGDAILQVTNNIFIARKTDHTAGIFGAIYGTSAQLSANHNLIYTPDIGSEDSMSKGSGYTWAAWQALAYDANSIGVTTSPLLNGDGTLTSSSPARSAGANLSTIFTADATGATRGVWDIGAFAYATGGGGGGGGGSLTNVVITNAAFSTLILR